MCHVQKRPCSISLHPHVLGTSESRQRTKGSRFGNLGFVFLVRGEVRYAPDSIALDLDVGGLHLSNQGGEPAIQHDGDFVFSFQTSAHASRKSYW